MKDLKDLVRPNVWNLKPYSSARDEFHGDASVFLDANENPWNVPYNRYPDPLQWKLKDRLAVLKGVDRSSIFLGNGSDEAIDLVIRAFCEPGLDSVVTISPSYGMYEVAANVNNVECRKVSLDENFDLDADRVLESADEWTKVIFLCSPNNPSGNSLDRGSIYKILKNYEGIVVIDEAYIDFSAYPSFLKELSGFPNLIVLQTLSKAWGAAGIRLGMALASPEKILSEPPFSYQVYPSDANFLLVNVGKADAMYNGLVKKGIVVRNRSNVQKCRGCLRITIGTPKENDSLLNAMKNMKL